MKLYLSEAKKLKTKYSNYRDWRSAMIDLYGSDVVSKTENIWKILEQRENSFILSNHSIWEDTFNMKNDDITYFEWKKYMLNKYGDDISVHLYSMWINTSELLIDKSDKKINISKNGQQNEIPISIIEAKRLNVLYPNYKDWKKSMYDKYGERVLTQINLIWEHINKRVSKESTQDEKSSVNDKPQKKPFHHSVVKFFIKEKFQSIKKSSLNDWLEYLWHHILPITIIILLIILLINQCDFTKHYSGRSY